MKTKISILLLFMAFAFGVSAQSIGDYIDVLYLKNGSMIKGIIVEQIPGKSIKIQTKDGSQYVYTMAEVEKFTREEVTEAKSNYMDNFKRKDKGFFMNLDALANSAGGGLRLTHGYRFGRFGNLGIAVGLEGVNSNYNFSYPVPVLSFNAVYSGEILDKRITPFYQIEAGYGISVDREPYSVTDNYGFDIEDFYYNNEQRVNYGGPMAGMALGVKFATKKKIYYKLALDARINSNFSDVTTYYSNDPLSSIVVPEFYKDFTATPGLGIRFGIGF